MSATPLHLHLVRHARYVAWNDHGPRFIGRSDPELSAEGTAQARALSTTWPNMANLPVWTSPLQRARQTAVLAFGTEGVVETELAIEIDFGILEGMTLKSAERLFPEAIRHFYRQGYSFEWAGGESWSTLLARARALVELVMTSGTCVLVSHAVILSAVVQVLTGRKPSSLWQFDFCAPLILEQPHSKGEWRIRATETR